MEPKAKASDYDTKSAVENLCTEVDHHCLGLLNPVSVISFELIGIGDRRNQYLKVVLKFDPVMDLVGNSKRKESLYTAMNILRANYPNDTHCVFPGSLNGQSTIKLTPASITRNIDTSGGRGGDGGCVEVKQEDRPTDTPHLTWYSYKDHFEAWARDTKSHFASIGRNPHWIYFSGTETRVGKCASSMEEAILIVNEEVTKRVRHTKAAELSKPLPEVTWRSPNSTDPWQWPFNTVVGMLKSTNRKFACIRADNVVILYKCEINGVTEEKERLYPTNLDDAVLWALLHAKSIQYREENKATDRLDMIQRIAKAFKC